jgi:hypothetical protein
MDNLLARYLGYGRDVAQGASNAVAGNVSAPVDGIAWLLRKAGLGNVVGDAPVGGSEWMSRMGLTAPPVNELAGLAGETLGMAAPIAIGAAAPQVANKLLKIQANAAAPRTLNPQAGAIVWHGSPHQFDAFDMSKIGTGEGAQAYGHGLYFADAPEVAQTYAGAGTALGGPAFETRLAKRMEKAQDAGRYGEAAAIEDLLINRSPAKALSRFTVENGHSPERVAEAQKTIQELAPKFKESALYKVDLPDEHIARMLDWDKPLSEQPANVRAALAKLDPESYHPTGGDYDANELGQQTYHRLLRTYGESKVAAMMAGPDMQIPGIKYLDQGSRAGGGGTSNYVVFDDKLPKILERR